MIEGVRFWLCYLFTGHKPTYILLTKQRQYYICAKCRYTKRVA